MKRLPFYIVHPGEGESLNLGAAMVAFKATGEDTAHAFTVCEFHLVAGAAALTLHAEGLTLQHYTGLYVLEGDVCLRLGADVVRVHMGGFALLRPDATCTLAHSGPATQLARVLCLTSPAGLEQHFTHLANQLLRPSGTHAAEG